MLCKDNFATGNGELLTVIADIAQCDRNVFFMNTKYKCLRCELPICNKCSVFEENKDGQPVKALNVMRCM